ncbi:MAG: aspartate aminotransferase family protein [Arenicellales bacterium]|jgi:glutamate-1-semialdehyde 2,1-aminomutase|nr:aspartate aminotransferase family protein [Arenicellales bacterium]
MTTQHNINPIAGGVMSLNRAIDPMRTFTRAKGAYIFDDQDKRYIDYHAAFSPYLLGHGDENVDDAVRNAIDRGASLIGAGITPWESEVSELIVDCVPGLEQIQLTNTGTEAVMYALRLARAATGRDDVLIVQGGYNGGTDYVSFNLMDSKDVMQDHTPGTAYPLRPITAGIPEVVQQTVRVVEYNDLSAVEMVLSNSDVAAFILEPILQNVGIIKPEPGYLQGVRKLCDRYGTVLIFDEVKTGFRHGLGGYQNVAGVTPDLSIFGKAVANGYPMGVVGGKESVMRYCTDSDVSRRVMVAGTYNGHPLVVAAAIATLGKLRNREAEIYGKLDTLGQQMESGLEQIFHSRNYPTTVVRQGSAFVVYFMDHAPVNWRDIAIHNDAAYDVGYRKSLIENGVFHFPVTTKQGSISFAHSEADIDQTLVITERVLNRIENS